MDCENEGHGLAFPRLETLRRNIHGVKAAVTLQRNVLRLSLPFPLPAAKNCGSHFTDRALLKDVGFALCLSTHRGGRKTGVLQAWGIPPNTNRRLSS